MFSGDFPLHLWYNLDSTMTSRLLWDPAHLPHNISSYHSLPWAQHLSAFWAWDTQCLCGPQGLCSSLCWSCLAMLILAHTSPSQRVLPGSPYLNSIPWPATLSYCSVFFVFFILPPKIVLSDLFIGHTWLLSVSPTRRRVPQGQETFLVLHCVSRAWSTYLLTQVGPTINSTNWINGCICMQLEP